MFHRLRSITGVGKILALTILYEVHDIARFETVQQFASHRFTLWLDFCERHRAIGPAPNTY